MSRKKPRSPQDKKTLSYAKDRRNAYGENDKASRKLIPLRKAMESRRDRRKVAQEVALLPNLDELSADLLESSVRQDVHRVGGWRKSADVPLGEVVARTDEVRESRAQRNARVRSQKPQEEDPETLKRLADKHRKTARRLSKVLRIGRKANTPGKFEQSFLDRAQALDERVQELQRGRARAGD